MSSHHFVKDNQEPALIIANGAACNRDLLDQLLEWNPFIVVLDGALHRALALGIKLDVVLGDFDGITDQVNLIKQQQPIELIYLPDQEKTDLEKAIEWLISKGHKAANIVWGTGFRADHTFNNLSNLVRYSKEIDLVMWDDYSKIWPCKSGYQKKYPVGSIISLLPIGTVKGIKTKGLKYPLNNEDLILGYRSGSSNEVVENGFVEIEFDSGQLLIMECYDNRNEEK